MAGCSAPLLPLGIARMLGVGPSGATPNPGGGVKPVVPAAEPWGLASKVKLYLPINKGISPPGIWPLAELSILKGAVPNSPGPDVREPKEVVWKEFAWAGKLFVEASMEDAAVGICPEAAGLPYAPCITPKEFTVGSASLPTVQDAEDVASCAGWPYWETPGAPMPAYVLAYPGYPD